MRVWRAHLIMKFQTVHQISAIGIQFYVAASFKFIAARLGVLTSEASHANHRATATVRQHQTHLQKNFKFRRNDGAAALVEHFSAITPLQ